MNREVAASVTRMLVARVIVAVVLGLSLGYAMGKSLADEAAEAKDLTLKEYIADFERHTEELESSAMPMPVAIIAGVVMLIAFLGVYELLVFAVDKALGAVDRRRGGSSPSAGP